MSQNFRIKIETVVRFDCMEPEEESLVDEIAVLHLGNASRIYRPWIVAHVKDMDEYGEYVVDSKEDIIWWLSDCRKLSTDCRLSSALAYFLALPFEEDDECRFRCTIIWC